jgi:hypothetical protein
MLTVLIFAAALGGTPVEAADQVAVIARTPAPGATAPVDPAVETVRVCRWETATGSNRRSRVCRDVPRQGVQDQQTREFMRDRQRYTPDPAG